MGRSATSARSDDRRTETSLSGPAMSRTLRVRRLRCPTTQVLLVTPPPESMQVTWTVAGPSLGFRMHRNSSKPPRVHPSAKRASVAGAVHPAQMWPPRSPPLVREVHGPFGHQGRRGGHLARHMLTRPHRLVDEHRLPAPGRYVDLEAAQLPAHGHEDQGGQGIRRSGLRRQMYSSNPCLGGTLGEIPFSGSLRRIPARRGRRPIRRGS